jgi:hypothetical protein
MIRLNNCYKTVIDESKVVAYNKDETDGIDVILTNRVLYVQYDSKEVRDKDIELLDQLFEVKDIKEQVEIEKLKKEVASHDMGITSERAREYISNLNACAPVKKEEYLTWDEVCNKKGEYFSAEISNVLVTALYNGHEITIFNGNAIASFVYSKDLFNALKLKKVE